MDINTLKGQESLKQEHKFLEYLKQRFPSYIFIQTPKNRPSFCDGIIIEGEYIVGIFESKCRNMTYKELVNFGSWLITNKKVENCRLLSEMLCVSFIGFLYLVPDDKVLSWQITDIEGNFLFPFDVIDTPTQETINGGTIMRKNAYLSIKYAKEL